jgi:outer membrane receptor for ferrienterochelin and colicins
MHASKGHQRRGLESLFIALYAFLTPVAALAQVADSATLRIRAIAHAAPLTRARVVSGPQIAETNTAGLAVLRLPAGHAVITISRIGYTPDTIGIALRAGQDTTIVASLEAQAQELESVVVAATRAERRVEDTPLRVEIVDEEEIAEKITMTPGDIAMMMNETPGLRVQTTSPSLGGANVRVQGLRGRYTLILVDGLPLYGGQAGGLGLLQIPPVDLGRVEVIKGTASALHGSSALGGVVNLISRRPSETAQREVLLNRTTRDGTDGVVYLANARVAGGSPWGATLLATGHRQEASDLDGDGWADLPGYERFVARPRLFYDTESGRSVFGTVGYTAEDRDGGTLPGRVAPDGSPYPERLRTRRIDAGLAARARLGAADLIHVRGSFVNQRHDHQFGSVEEHDLHRTWFGETSITLPRAPWTYVIGFAFQQEVYRNNSVSGFDYDAHIPAAFAQADFDAAPWLVLSGSARFDHHSEFGSLLSPRLSALVRLSDRDEAHTWTVRVSGGGGAFAPVPFTEETEVTGLAPLRLLQQLAVERSISASMDVNGTFHGEHGRVELNATLFGSRIREPIAEVRDTGTTGTGATFIALRNAPLPTETWGAEFLARFVRGVGRLTTFYTYLRGSEWDPVSATDRRSVPLAPRHAAGIVASLEQEGVSRLGLELYYTGRQTLDANPYRTTSPAYVVVGLLAERVFNTRIGRARLFVNAENLGNVRQTRFDPLVLPTRGEGGRWTVDAWTELTGFVLNGGVRVALGSPARMP